MNNSKYYLNCETGEITYSHKEAMEWYRDGSQIEIWRNGKIVLKWLM